MITLNNKIKLENESLSPEKAVSTTYNPDDTFKFNQKYSTTNISNVN